MRPWKRGTSAAQTPVSRGVPGPGVFPFWNLDLNFLTVPTVSQFVVDALHEEIGLYDLLIARWPAGDDDGRAALRVIRDEKARQVDPYRAAGAAQKRLQDLQREGASRP